MKSLIKVATCFVFTACLPLYSEVESHDAETLEDIVESRPQMTIAEKLQSFSSPTNTQDLNAEHLEALAFVNDTLKIKHAHLEKLYKQAHTLSLKEREDPMIFYSLKSEISRTKQEIQEIQKKWSEEAKLIGRLEDYALWHQPDATLLQLVIDYGDSSHLYIVPPEIGGIPCSISSNLPVPVEAWGDCLELILAHYGIEVRELHPFVKELSFMSTDLNQIRTITDKPEDLDLLPKNARLCFVLSPNSTDPRPTYQLLLKFSNMATTDIEILAGKLFITGANEEIQELLKIHSFSEKGGATQESHIVQLKKIPPAEMEKMLTSSFNGNGMQSSSLRILPLDAVSRALFITGTKDDVKKALTFIADLEAQIEDPKEKTVFWYTAKHSDPEELATVLARVYDMLAGNNVSSSTSEGSESASKKDDDGEKKEETPPLAVDTSKTGNDKKSHKTADGRNNFIVDAKTGSLIMVVEQKALPKIRELLRRLDVPKKMVQLEVLLFERKLSKNNKSGLNLLRIGSTALGEAALGGKWTPVETGRGILEFFTSRGKESGIPAYDAAYQFLLGQEDVQINASPSITTTNQTPAIIKVVDEISVDAGATDKKAHNYSRAQYGIIIEITPTINLDEEESENGFITLDTDITFDTTQNNKDNRPDVTRRHIKNHVRIADGETVILGGLRRKTSSDSRDSIPFLGEIPGIGKLFSITEGSSSNTEMFMFITPKIISDPIKDAADLRNQQLKKRPGDVPLFLHELLEAREREKKGHFEGSLHALFGPQESFTSTYQSNEEYEGSAS
jgi:general secretion pathway protein D